jgi:cell division septum initiation protein DivIVA
MDEYKQNNAHFREMSILATKNAHEQYILEAKNSHEKHMLKETNVHEKQMLENSRWFSALRSE